MVWSFRDSRHPIEIEADLRNAAARTWRRAEPDVRIDPWPLKGTETGEPTPEIAKAISDATDRLTAERVVRGAVREGRVALEIKGLKASMLKLQARVDRLNQIATSADETGAKLEGHLSDIGGQLGAHVSDIEFAANVLGNSSGPSLDGDGEQGQG